MIKPRILLCPDKHNWSFDHIAQFLIQTLSNKYTFDKLYRQDIITSDYVVKNREAYIKYDIVYLFNYQVDYLNDVVPCTKIIKGIYQGNTTRKALTKSHLQKCAAINLGSKLIYKEFEVDQEHFPPLFYATGAINTDMFSPSSTCEERSFTVGWTGRPNRHFKGFYTHVVPAIEKVKNTVPNILFSTRFSGPFETLPQFYHAVDVLVIASDADAGPSSFLEAGACGVPSISTHIGFPEETIQHRINGLFVERNIDHIAETIIEVEKNRPLLCSMGAQIRKDVVEQWSYPVRSGLWEKMFDFVLERQI